MKSNTKYFDGETKRTCHPALGIGTCYRFTDNWFFKFEACYVFPNKKKLSENIKVAVASNTYDIKTKASVKLG